MNKSINVKRPVTIKTVVTEDFKRQAIVEISKEMQLLDSQIMQLEIQSKQIHDQVTGYKAMYGDDAPKEVTQALDDISGRLQQMSSIKQELHSHKDTITHMGLDNIIVTGSLENYVELSIGENIYDKFKTAEIIVKDGIIQEINL